MICTHTLTNTTPRTNRPRDTAQAIQQGSAFRFSDVRSIIARADPAAPAPKVVRLLKNYRSHSGILEFGAAILDMMHVCFPRSADRIQADKGLARGPNPGLWVAPTFEKLAVTLARDRKLVLLVRDETRDHLKATMQRVIGRRIKELQVELDELGELGDCCPPDENSGDSRQTADSEAMNKRSTELKKERDELKDGLSLTVLGFRESKGLEFEDVAIVNFFGDADDAVATAWRAALSLDWSEGGGKAEREQQAAAKRIPTALETELKYLYTAITRARGKLYITEVEPDSLGSQSSSSIGASCLSKFRHVFVPRLVSTAEILPRAMLAEEWLVRGLKFAMAAQGATFEEATKFLSLAIEAFHKAGKMCVAFETRARELLQSYTDQNAMRNPAMDDVSRVNVGVQSARSLLVHGFLDEARGVLEALPGSFGEPCGKLMKLTERYRKEVSSFTFPETRLEFFDEQVRKGDVRHMIEMVKLLEHGAPTRKQDLRGALEMLRRIAATGCAYGDWQLARTFRRGNLGCARDVRAAIRHATRATEDRHVLEQRLVSFQRLSKRELSTRIRDIQIDEGVSFKDSFLQFKKMVEDKRRFVEGNLGSDYKDGEDDESSLIQYYMTALLDQPMADSSDRGEKGRQFLFETFRESPGGFTFKSLEVLALHKPSAKEDSGGLSIGDYVQLKEELKGTSEKLQAVAKGTIGEIKSIAGGIYRVKFKKEARERRVGPALLERTDAPLVVDPRLQKFLKPEKTAEEKAKIAREEREKEEQQRKEQRKEYDALVNFSLREVTINVPKGVDPHEFQPYIMARLVDKNGWPIPTPEKHIEPESTSFVTQQDGQVAVKLHVSNKTFQWDLLKEERDNRRAEMSGRETMEYKRKSKMEDRKFRDMRIHIEFKERYSRTMEWRRQEAERKKAPDRKTLRETLTGRKGKKSHDDEGKAVDAVVHGEVDIPLREYLSDELKTEDERRAAAEWGVDRVHLLPILTNRFKFLGWYKVGDVLPRVLVVKREPTEYEREQERKYQERMERMEEEERKKERNRERKAQKLQEKEAAERARAERSAIELAKKKQLRAQKAAELLKLRSTATSSLSGDASNDSHRLAIAALVDEMKRLDSSIYPETYLLDALRDAGHKLPIIPGVAGASFRLSSDFGHLLRRSKHYCDALTARVQTARNAVQMPLIPEKAARMRDSMLEEYVMSSKCRHTFSLWQARRSIKHSKEAEESRKVIQKKYTPPEEERAHVTKIQCLVRRIRAKRFARDEKEKEEVHTVSLDLREDGEIDCATVILGLLARCFPRSYKKLGSGARKAPSPWKCTPCLGPWPNRWSCLQGGMEALEILLEVDERVMVVTRDGNKSQLKEHLGKASLFKGNQKSPVLSIEEASSQDLEFQRVVLVDFFSSAPLQLSDGWKKLLAKHSDTTTSGSAASSGEGGSNLASELHLPRSLIALSQSEQHYTTDSTYLELAGEYGSAAADKVMEKVNDCVDEVVMEHDKASEEEEGARRLRSPRKDGLISKVAAVLREDLGQDMADTLLYHRTGLSSDLQRDFELLYQAIVQCRHGLVICETSMEWAHARWDAARSSKDGGTKLA